MVMPGTNDRDNKHGYTTKPASQVLPAITASGETVITGYIKKFRLNSRNALFSKVISPFPIFFLCDYLHMGSLKNLCGLAKRPPTGYSFVHT